MKDEVADEVEKKMENTNFDQRPLASLAAQNDRKKIHKVPENKYVKLGNKRNIW